MDPDPQRVDRIEMHFHDNPGTRGAWISAPLATTSHPDLDSENGLRDYTVDDAIAGGVFFMDYEGVVPPALQGLPASSVFDTVAGDDVFFQASLIANHLDDTYVAFDYTETDRDFSLEDSLWFYYTAAGATINATNVVTDLAGNRLKPFQRYVSIQRVPPEFANALAIAGTDIVYIRFSKRILGPGGDDIVDWLAGPGTPDDLLEIYDANTGLAVPGLSITAITPIQTREATAGTFATLDVFLTLNQPIPPDGALDWRIRPDPAGVDLIEDEFTTRIRVAEVNRITDVALGIVQPVAAWNEIQRSDLYGDEFDGLLDLTDFDGSGVLLADRDTSVQVAIVDAVNAGRAVQLYYDVDPDPSVVTNTARPETPNAYWLPVESQIVDDPETGERETLPPNLEARRLLPLAVNGQNIEFTLDSDDPEIVPGAEVQIILMIDGVPAARFTDPTDPRTVAPWVITYRRFIEQRGGVTILNNVIYPANGDVTVLDYELQSAGMVTIHVFTLDGARVKTLVRGRQTAGRYQTSWDGSNTSGQTVASGLYFIRIVGPGIDEIRKVLVAK